MASPGSKNHLLIVNFPNERRIRRIIDEFVHDPIYKDDEIVVVTDQIDSFPSALRNVYFVRGSPLEEGDLSSSECSGGAPGHRA